MTPIPTTPKRFKKWLDKQLDLPADLEKAAIASLHDREILALNRNSADYEAIKKIYQPKVDAFNAQYAGYERLKLSR